MTRIRTAADTALLVEAADLDESMRLLPRLHEAALLGVTELVPAARTILVRFDPRAIAAGDLAAALLAVEPSDRRTTSDAVVTIPVRYDGQDLEEVAALLSTSPEGVVARHRAAAWSVAFTGYAPGFGYLVSDDPGLQVPRRSSPRTRIPAGSVGLAGAFSGVYPRESPGGWQLIGRTDARMWDLDREPPALLQPGAAVRFERVERELVALAPPEPPAVVATHALEVVRPGLQLLVQDLGRPSMAAMGVSQSGVADRGAMRAVNRAVGNDAHAAVLELAGGGAVLRARGPAVVALAGGLADATVEGAAGSAAVVHGAPLALDDGDELRIGGVRAGLRVIVGIRGGIAAEPVLGSVATDTLAGLGPAPLTAGSVVPLHGPAAAPSAVAPEAAPAPALPAPGDELLLRIVLGPRDDWFAPAAIARLTSESWEVTPRSDRVGVRLAGAPLERVVEGELPSEGAVTGAIQVPPDGQPVLFLADHPLTGGYPIVGAVVDADLDLAGQLPPGARVRLRIHDEKDDA
ncbi:carboxyltransferase domain-containing protein [Agrococcus sp. SGAir0287]|uniref:5-oxoprolinase subunit B/C family protein n=1 Tax=Agrococcus sp. SGAir0287 TaxID=2070347 RepID=UPI0010CCFFF6|nr:carboxyltransferase domain-containing protein [Agrococcus sp. SGAir0287]QCR19277.1 allophanate hydrolase [Agrococcus sp. SGAir0287]